MRRHEVSDKLWEQIKPLIAGQGSSHDNRLFVNAVLFQAKTGIHWRDLPERFGKWNSVYQRFNRWSKRGVWEKLFELTTDPDPLIIAIDSTTIRANQVASGQKKNSTAASCLGRSRGGLTSKIHLTVNAVGRFCRIIVSAGNQSDYKQARALVKDYKPLAALADKGYDADWLIAALQQAGVREIVIPPKKNRKQPRVYDKELYKGRNIVERAINKLKHYRSIATRYDKTARNFYSFICLAIAVINLK